MGEVKINAAGSGAPSNECADSIEEQNNKIHPLKIRTKSSLNPIRVSLLIIIASEI